MLSDLINRPCTLKRPTGSQTTDRYGNKRSAIVDVATVCELQQRRRDERDDQSELSDTLWALFLPAETVVTTADKIVVDATTYELVGDPWQARNPRTGQASHIEATVRRAA